MEKIIDGANIEYAPGKVLECRAVADDAELGLRPVNLLDYHEEPTANELALTLSRTAAEKIFEYRSYRIPNSLPLPEFDIYTAKRVSDFITGRLGMEPHGRFAFIRDMGKMVVSGITFYPSQTALVSQRETCTYVDDGSPGYNEYAAQLFNAISAQGVAVHELTHLSGAQDIAYFYLNDDASAVTNVITPTSTLEDFPSSVFSKRIYFEEGLATLVHSMYLWTSNANTLNLSNSRGEAFEVARSSSGQSIYVPTRISNPVTRHHEYTACAWGIERLVQLDPAVWDILMASRRYGARAHIIRKALRACIDSNVPGLFDAIDGVDARDVDQTIDMTARITHEVNRRKR